MSPVVTTVHPKPMKLRNFAAEWDWRGPGLPRIWGLALIPPVPGVISARNYYACGPTGIYYDQGENPMAAQPMNDGLPANAWVSAIALDPNDPARQTLFASAHWKVGGVKKGDVFKTTDLANWVALNVLPPSNRDQQGILALTFVDPAHQPNTLYAVGDPGVLKTTDGGATWVAVNDGLPSWMPSQPTVPAFVRAIAIDPAHTQIHYVAAEWIDAAGKECFDVYKWNPGGPWTALGLGHTALALAVDAKGWAVYAGTTEGLYKYARQNGAFTWSHLTGAYPDAAFPDGSVQALAVDPTDYNTLFAGTRDGGVFWSTDGGLGWVAMNSDLTNFEISSHLDETQVNVLGLTVEPSGPGSTGKTLYAGIEGGVIRIQNV